MKRKGLLSFLFFAVVAFALTSCVSTGVKTEVKGGGPNIQQVVTYNGPKARISVAKIKCKAAKCSGAIGDGLRDMLISGLFKTNKFIVLGGKEEMKEMMEELDLSASGYVKQKSAIQAGGWEAADIIIFGSITAFEPDASGMDVGGGGLVPGFLGGIKFGKKEAYIAMDLRIVDVRSRRIVNTTTVEGKASSFNIGGGGAGWGGVGVLTAGLGVYKNTPMEKAVRVLIDNAVNYIASQTPPSYFRYDPATGEPIGGPQGGGPKRLGSKGKFKRVAGAAGSGGLKRLSVGFKPGSKVLFAEDFSKCTERPKTLRITKGIAECVEFDGRRWVVNITPNSTIARKINIKGDFALEMDIYIHCKSCWAGSPGIWIALGRNGKGEAVKIQGMSSGLEFYFAGKKMTTKLSTKTVYTLAIQQKGGKVRLFVDGRRVATEEVSPVKRNKNRDGFVISQWGNLDDENYVLVTNIRVTKYKR